MNVHKNARLTPYRRQELVALVARGTALTVAAQAFGVSRQTARKWVLRKDRAAVVEDGAWLQDRSSRPHTSPRATEPKIQLGAKVLRHQRWTCAEIATAVGVSAATIARTLRRVGLSRRLRLEPPPMGRRYEHPAPGDLLHLDTKKLGRIRGIGHRISGQRQHRARGIGWEFLHIAIDDHSRVGLHGAAGRRTRGHDERLPAPGPALVSRPRRAHPARAHRQRVGLPLPKFPRHVPRPAGGPPPDAAVHAADERQGRAVHSDCPPRMGVQEALLHLRGSHADDARLARTLQCGSSAQWN